jgi:hypothetical protein
MNNKEKIAKHTATLTAFERIEDCHIEVVVMCNT